jgi:hypothetical protein
MNNKIAYCGLYCGACSYYLATINNKLPDLSDQLKIPKELLACEGCRSQIVNLYCRICKIKKCCLRKGILLCNQCDEFPCSVLKAFDFDNVSHHTGVIESLIKLSKTGEDNWLINQNEKWSCTNCHIPFYWYDKTCKNCGNTLSGLEKTLF